MRILVISFAEGAAAPVFECMVNQLSIHHHVDLITNSSGSKNIGESINKIFRVERPFLRRTKISPYVEKLSYICLGLSCFDVWTSKRVSIDSMNYDVVISFCSSYNLLSLEIGHRVIKKNGGCLVTYFVDAVPEPNWWIIGGRGMFSSKIQNLIYYCLSSLTLFASKGVRRYLTSRTRFVSLFSASNSKMLEYEKPCLNKECKSTAVYLTPNSGVFHFYPDINSSKFIFIYAGAIYGIRKVEYLFKAFEKVLNVYPNSYIYFIGTKERILKDCPSKIISKIKFFPFTKDLSEFYTSATALLDIDAAVDNDVYLSSKVSNYLFVNRPIICETGINSPARELLSDMKTVLMCRHDLEELYNAMIFCIQNRNKFDYSERTHIIQQFSVKYVVDTMIRDVHKLLNK